MLLSKFFITVYLIHMYSNIFIGHLTNLLKTFYGVLLNDVIEISRLIPKFRSWLNSQIILSGSVFSVTNTHDWVKRYMKHNYSRSYITEKSAMWGWFLLFIYLKVHFNMISNWHFYSLTLLFIDTFPTFKQ